MVLEEEQQLTLEAQTVTDDHMDVDDKASSVLVTDEKASWESAVSLTERVVLIALTLVNGAGMAVQAGVNVSMGFALCGVEGDRGQQNTLGAGLISFIGGWLLLLILNGGEASYRGEVPCGR